LCYLHKRKNGCAANLDRLEITIMNVRNPDNMSSFNGFGENKSIQPAKFYSGKEMACNS